MKRSASPLVWLCLATVAMVGCAQPPTDVIEAARGSVAAVEGEGTEYAASAYANAQSVIQRMDAEVAAQADRFALSRNYDRATELAAEAEAAASAVTEAVEAEQERLQSETTQMIGDAEGVIADARADLEEYDEETAAPLLQDLDGAEASLAAANQALAAEDLQGARREASSGLQAANNATSDIADLVAAAEAPPDVEEQSVRAMAGGIDVPRNVYVDGGMVSAGAYTVRRGSGAVPPVPGLGADSNAWVELVSDEDGSVTRAMAATIPDAEMAEVAEGAWYPRNQAYVDELVGGEYVRIWLNRDGVTYLVHATTSAP